MARHGIAPAMSSEQYEFRKEAMKHPYSNGKNRESVPTIRLPNHTFPQAERPFPDPFGPVAGKQSLTVKSAILMIRLAIPCCTT